MDRFDEQKGRADAVLAFKLTKDGHIHAHGRFGVVSKRHVGRPVGEFTAELRKHKN